MPKKLHTEILIQASPAKVWAIFSDFAAYPAWNPFVKKLEGQPCEGGKIKVWLPGMAFAPKVLSYKPPHELRWKGKLLLPGLFDGEHYFVFSGNANGTTTLRHGEIFSGLLVPLFAKMLDTKTLEGFKQMNEALKQRVEKSRPA